jgi:hypothetical protein
VVCVFARKTSEPLTSLVKQIDKKIGENGNFKSFVVITTAEKDPTESNLKMLAKDAGIKYVPLTIYGEPGGPPDYELAKAADITVLMWKRSKVKVNHAYKGELTDKNVATIVTDISKVLAD